MFEKLQAVEVSTEIGNVDAKPKEAKEAKVPEMAMATSKQLETQAQPQLEIVTAGKCQNCKDVLGTTWMTKSDNFSVAGSDQILIRP